jgi:hypothetical protein
MRLQERQDWVEHCTIADASLLGSRQSACRALTLAGISRQRTSRFRVPGCDLIDGSAAGGRRRRPRGFMTSLTRDASEAAIVERTECHRPADGLLPAGRTLRHTAAYPRPSRERPDPLQ